MQIHRSYDGPCQLDFAAPLGAHESFKASSLQSTLDWNARSWKNCIKYVQPFTGPQRKHTMNRQQGILLRGGTILQHNDHDEVEALLDTDVLIEGSHIRKIGKNIKPSPDVGVLDCKGKIISPGFIDTHHHVWQTQLKGRHSDDTLLDYHPKGTISKCTPSTNELAIRV